LNAGWVAALSALVVAVGTVTGWAGRWIWRLLRRCMEFFDDWGGEPERAGLPARPGVMARLASVEKLTAELAAEMRPNHGTSLRDVVHRTAADVADIKTDQASMRSRMEQLENQRAGREGKVP
jgi:hypothetical protein